MASVRRIIVGLCAAWLACLGVPAAAQPARAPLAEMPVRIDGIDVEEVARLDPGTRLSFSVFGTPGATASLQIAGARNGLLLREAERGVYEGTYTIEADERIAADAAVIATLRRGAEVAQSVLDEPLVLGAAMSDGRVASGRARRRPNRCLPRLRLRRRLCPRRPLGRRIDRSVAAWPAPTAPSSNRCASSRPAAATASPARSPAACSARSSATRSATATCAASRASSAPSAAR